MQATFSSPKRSLIEWPLLLAVAALMLVGTAFVFSATSSNPEVAQLPWYRQYVVRQVVAYALGAGLAAFLCVIDYHIVTRWAVVFYWSTILLLALTPFVGVTRLGARRWIDFGPFSIQPSEFAKLALILLMANFLSRPIDELRRARIILKGVGLTLLPFVLILKEPDLGSALVLLPVSWVMMLVAGVPSRFLYWMVGGLILLVTLILVDILLAPPRWQIKLEEYQRHRLLVWFNRDFAPKDATPEEKLRLRQVQREKTYNVEQALISVGSGGMTGKGWRQGAQSSLGYLPRRVSHNDFIFSVLAEEKGFVGSFAVLSLYAIVFFAGLKIAGQARDRIGKLLAVGVVTLLFVHVFINIGMNIRLMPVTGIPLPLLSYGGTSVLCSLLALGLLQNVSIYRKSY